MSSLQESVFTLPFTKGRNVFLHRSGRNPLTRGSRIQFFLLQTESFISVSNARNSNAAQKESEENREWLNTNSDPPSLAALCHRPVRTRGSCSQ